MPKMEDRKRPALSAADDVAPPAKRLATINGSRASSAAAAAAVAADADSDLKEDTFIEKYQKGAIYRQMQEYKRRVQTLEEQLEELRKKCLHHDEHIRLIEVWWRQFLEEVELLAGSLPKNSQSSEPILLTGFRFDETLDFKQHLNEFGKAVQAQIESLFQRISSSHGQAPSATELEANVARLLAKQKDFLAQVDRVNAEKEQLSEQLNMATLRYIRAERKLDRARSTQVQKLEQQLLAGSTTSTKATAENGKEEPLVAQANVLELQHKLEEAASAETKLQEQVESLMTDMKTLQDENLSLRARRETVTDEDFIRTDVFKAFKAQNEDLIKKVNHLEAMTKQLKEHSDKLESERTLFKTQIEEEAQTTIQELEEEIRQRDQDLARVRSARDEILADRDMRKAAQDQEMVSIDHLKEFTTASEDRIAALESQLQYYKAQGAANTGTGELEELSPEELRERYRKMARDLQAINVELPSIEQAYKKFKSLAQTKALDYGKLEEQMAMARAEKAKADQKYFAARKDTDTRMQENRTLRMQNTKSSEIIAQLKDSEAQHRSLLGNLEKQLVDLKQVNEKLEADKKKMETASNESARRADSCKNQIGELTNLVKAKDAAAATIRERNMSQDVELERLRLRLDHIEKDRDIWKQKALSNSSEEEEMLRKSLLCAVCKKNFKNTVLKTCGHIFCNECVEARINNRMRKCPNCSRAFDKMDSMAVHGLG